MRPADAEATGSRANAASASRTALPGLRQREISLIEDSFFGSEVPGLLVSECLRVPVRDASPWEPATADQEARLCLNSTLTRHGSSCQAANSLLLRQFPSGKWSADSARSLRGTGRRAA